MEAPITSASNRPCVEAAVCLMDFDLCFLGSPGARKRSGGQRSSAPSGRSESGICSRKSPTLRPSTPSPDPSSLRYVETVPWNWGQWQPSIDVIVGLRVLVDNPRRGSTPRENNHC
ncbi:hypothetical protein BHE74_00004166 [Ensete ventricosum]|nr:hypothetical protein GW17_00030294 [Ensete ventricosum]RWW87028.1 hypothetical protein BHE74_00004166 [Ensete ventricosum]RZR93943.1 hypothetical protein BHM03_00022527 [Ensete ventricosum]